jgi:hypothetical protein
MACVTSMAALVRMSRLWGPEEESVEEDEECQG